MSGPARKAGTWIVVALGVIAIFDAPSAYAISRGAPWWLALMIGLAAFPIVPLVWHLARERGPASPRPRRLTGRSRFLLRTAVIGCLVAAGLIAIARQRTWYALRDHALWFASKPPSAGALRCEAWAAMEQQCDSRVVASYGQMVQSCEAANVERWSGTWFKPALSPDLECAFTTNSCADYAACTGSHE